VLADIAMDDAETAGLPVEKDTRTARIACDAPRLVAPGARRSEKERTVNVPSPYPSGAHDFDNGRFRRDAPTLAARAGVLALVPGVKIQAEH